MHKIIALCIRAMGGFVIDMGQEMEWPVSLDAPGALLIQSDHVMFHCDCIRQPPSLRRAVIIRHFKKEFDWRSPCLTTLNCRLKIEKTSNDLKRCSAGETSRSSHEERRHERQPKQKGLS